MGPHGIKSSSKANSHTNLVRLTSHHIMSSAPKNLSSSSSSSKPPKIPISRNPNPNPNPKPKPRPVTFYREDMAVARASHLTRHQLLRRRAFFLRQLSRCYRDHYWALMEELKIQYKQYYWNFGAMALTSFCHLHILSDSKQKLYKPCDYVIKRFGM
ncbi:hypothetical protein Patl1_05509 [Pistacia atlantica]|uniref:Uncharacterized protein n=1 Tax=Pistacia atlantica TaxID=434234 RepID=A0ACC1BT89_9ROSI|nr:hypothetical protein Patl1_05509 [Pistacia atlantica]